MFEREQHIDQMDAAWNDYCEYLGYEPNVDFAFSKKTKRKMVERDGGPYPGYDFGKNEASHHDHSRDNPDYDDPSNGHIVNRPTHYIEHRAAEYGEHDNGLDEDINRLARKSVNARMTDDEKAYLKYLDSIGR